MALAFPRETDLRKAPAAQSPRPGAIRAALLAWYDVQARVLAWRVAPADRAAGLRPDPYRVWLSEIMLQQTTVAAVGPYFARFLDRFATVEALAVAPQDEVLGLWAGLGYYARARNLHACAKMVAGPLGGRFPETEEGLRALPGVGAYTAAAVAAIAFDQPANVVDGNVERVMSRLFAVETPLPSAKAELARLAADFVTADRPGDWAQALMDLGATVCAPRSPACHLCPLQAYCAAFAMGAPETFPRKTAKPAKPQRFGACFVLTDGQSVLLRRRPDKGLLAAMLEPPGTDWRDRPFSAAEALAQAPAAVRWEQAGRVRHVFTHFALELTVYRASGAAPGMIPRAALGEAALPTLFRKVLALGLG